jgi:anthranilate phosphoribosyltransferase
MRHVVDVRRKLGVPTLFNLLGPLCNPAGATHQLLGTGTGQAQEKIAAALAELGTMRSAVVHAYDGQDEVTISGPTEVIEVRGNELKRHRWSPRDFGLPPGALEAMQAGDPAASAAIIGVENPRDVPAPPRRLTMKIVSTSRPNG